MFSGASSFNQPLGDWSARDEVTFRSYIFEDALALDQDLGWCVGKGTLYHAFTRTPCASTSCGVMRGERDELGVCDNTVAAASADFDDAGATDDDDDDDDDRRHDPPPPTLKKDVDMSPGAFTVLMLILALTWPIWLPIVVIIIAVWCYCCYRQKRAALMTEQNYELVTVRPVVEDVAVAKMV